MANINPQAVLVSNTKIRPAADRFAQLYNFMKALSIQSTADGWLALYPNDSVLIGDGSDIDGRTPITNADVRTFMTLVGTFITFMEQSASANLNLATKISVNAEHF